MKKTALIILAILLFSPSVFAEDDFDNLLKLQNGIDVSVDWKCIVDKKYYCAEASCEKVASNTFVVLDLKNNLYKRCDKKGCDKYSMQLVRSGIFSNIVIDGYPLMARLLNDGSEFTETSGLGTAWLNSFGKCEKYN